MHNMTREQSMLFCAIVLHMCKALHIVSLYNAELLSQLQLYCRCGSTRVLMLRLGGGG
jgi:hypothetical protein